jgi:CheY-like chemotaxis protein
MFITQQNLISLIDGDCGVFRDALKIEKDIPAILYGDSGKFNQIMVNLVGNAIKFTEKGSVTIHICKTKMDKDKVTLKVDISDTGIGIREKDNNKLFKSFTQLDNSTSKSYPGTGLGLAIVKRYTELLNGKVSLKSESGQGSTFTLEIPFKLSNKIQTEITPESKQKSLSDIHSNKKKIHVLLAEDDGINQLYLKSFLTSNGLVVDGVFNGNEVLEKYDNNSYDIILMDGQMPKMDGFETTRLIRKKEKKTKIHTPIIAITGYTISGDREKFIASGMDDYITKPIDEKRLLEIINRLTLKQEKNN